MRKGCFGFTVLTKPVLEAKEVSAIDGLRLVAKVLIAALKEIKKKIKDCAREPEWLNAKRKEDLERHWAESSEFLDVLFGWASKVALWHLI